MVWDVMDLLVVTNVDDNLSWRFNDLVESMLKG